MFSDEIRFELNIAWIRRNWWLTDLNEFVLRLFVEISIESVANLTHIRVQP